MLHQAFGIMTAPGIHIAAIETAEAVGIGQCVEYFHEEREGIGQCAIEIESNEFVFQFLFIQKAQAT